MDIKKYLYILWHRKWVVLITTILTTLVVLLGLQFYSPLYQATATLRVATSRSSQITYEELMYADRLLKTFASIAATASIREEVIKDFALNAEPEIDVQVLPNTELIQITISHEYPDVARDIANYVAQKVIQRSQEIDTRLNVISIIDPAVSPDSPSIPPLLIIAAGAVVGLVGGLGLAFVFEYLNQRMYTSKQIENASGLALLGKIPPVRKGVSSLASEDCPRSFEEAFRILRTNLLMQNPTHPIKTLLVTSPDPGAGKSTVLANLANSLSKTGKKIVMVDGDMRKPRLHAICQISNEAGLSDVLAGKRKVEEVLQWIDTNICLISSGPLPADPAFLLHREKLSALVDELAPTFDYILLDSPAMCAVPDAKLMAGVVDGIVLVVNMATATEEIMFEVKNFFAEVPAKNAGMVINRVNLNHGYYYYQ